MKTKILFGLLVVLITACNKEENTNDKIETYNLEGYAQKGPFLAGADVTIIELDHNLVQTGKAYFSTIDNNAGHFLFPNVTFNSNFVELKVKGRYFDENLCGIPIDELTLYSIVDLSEDTKININILTHIEESRIKYLVSKNFTFQEAQSQAHTELLKVFNLEDISVNAATYLDITSYDIDGGVLLLISSIILKNQGTGLIPQEFISNIATDFREDGDIDSEIIQNALVLGAYSLDIDGIKVNLTKKYSDMGISIKPYEIQMLREQFLNNTPYQNAILDLFPTSINDTINLLALNDTTIIDKNLNYCIYINSTDGYTISGGHIFLSSNNFNNLSTQGIDWYEDNNVYRSGIEEYIESSEEIMIPFEFWDSGQVFIETWVFSEYDYLGINRNRLIIWN